MSTKSPLRSVLLPTCRSLHSPNSHPPSIPISTSPRTCPLMTLCDSRNVSTFLTTTRVAMSRLKSLPQPSRRSDLKNKPEKFSILSTRSLKTPKWISRLSCRSSALTVIATTSPTCSSSLKSSTRMGKGHLEWNSSLRSAKAWENVSPLLRSSK